MLRATTTSSKETQGLAAAVADVVTNRDILMLVGDMGAGKTTFTQGFAVALGIDEVVTSPTFVLMQSYAGRLKLHHVDIYRLDHLQEVIDLGLIELLDEGGVALIEWGNLATPVLPHDFLEVGLRIDEEDDDRRHLTFESVGSAWSAKQKALAEALAPWLVDGDGGRS